MKELPPNCLKVELYNKEGGGGGGEALSKKYFRLVSNHTS